MKEFLMTVDLFQGLPDADLGRLAEMARRETFKKGDVVFRERDAAGKVYGVESGVIEITRTRGDGRAARLLRLERGELLGETALFDEAPRPATATAAVAPETHLISWEVPPLQMLLANDPLLASRIYRTLLRKLGMRLRASADAVHALLSAVDPVTSS